jgi:hypothetical protein
VVRWSTYSDRIPQEGKNSRLRLEDNQGNGVEVTQTYGWIALVVIVGGLVLSGWWYQHRRAWSTIKQDEAMRRHVNRNYE